MGGFERGTLSHGGRPRPAFAAVARLSQTHAAGRRPYVLPAGSGADLAGAEQSSPGHRANLHERSADLHAGFAIAGRTVAQSCPGRKGSGSADQQRPRQLPISKGLTNQCAAKTRATDSQ
jgi:hypothetical protein